MNDLIKNSLDELSNLLIEADVRDDDRLYYFYDNGIRCIDDIRDYIENLENALEQANNEQVVAENHYLSTYNNLEPQIFEERRKLLECENRIVIKNKETKKINDALKKAISKITL